MDSTIRVFGNNSSATRPHSIDCETLSIHILWEQIKLTASSEHKRLKNERKQAYLANLAKKETNSPVATVDEKKILLEDPAELFFGKPCDRGILVPSVDYLPSKPF